jgi:hypothetical protein
MENFSTYVGLDVHMDSIDVSIAEAGRTGEIRHYGKIASDLRPVDTLIGKLKKPGRALRVVYEAGPSGFPLYRHLHARGVDCIVVSPSMIPKRPGERIKTDRRDSAFSGASSPRGRAASDLRAHRAGRSRARPRTRSRGCGPRSPPSTTAVEVLPASSRRPVRRSRRLDAAASQLALGPRLRLPRAADCIPGIHRVHQRGRRTGRATHRGAAHAFTAEATTSTPR